MTERSLLIAGPGHDFSVALAERFHEEGFAIGAMGHTPRALVGFKNTLKDRGITAQIQRAELSEVTQVQRAVAGFAISMPPWQCLAYCATQISRGNIYSLRPDQLAQDLQSNVVGALALTQSLMYGWQRARGASVLLMNGRYDEAADSNRLSGAISGDAVHSLAVNTQASLGSSDVNVKAIDLGRLANISSELREVAAAWMFYDAHAEGLARTDSV